MASRDAENVHNRTTHAWSLFENHAELAFIEVEWLEQYRERRKEIVRKRIEDAQTRGETLPTILLGGKEETVLNKSAIPKIQALMTKHLSWHPFKFPSTMPPLDNSSPQTSRYIWLRHASEMHALCKKWKEGYAWEYLWKNWYKWDKWELWARSVTLDYYPIIQTNAPVETHWNQIKNRALVWFSRIRLDHLCAEMQQVFLPRIINKIRQKRKGIKDSAWHHNMVTEWRKLDRVIATQDEADVADAEKLGMDPNSNGSPAANRQDRMLTMHHTDIKAWRCQCAGFNHSPYHICTHLIRLYGKPYPLKREAVRQHCPPLLFIEGLHNESQRFHFVPSTERQIDPPASLEQLGLSQEHLAALTEAYGDTDEDEPDYSRVEEDKLKLNAWIKDIERACDYAKQEMAHSRERFLRLPKPGMKGLSTLVKLSQGAHALDHGRRRRQTWGPERAGGNMYRD